MIWDEIGESIYQRVQSFAELATALQRNPPAVAAMREAGWEIASHGLKWIDYKGFTKDDERAHMAEAIRIHERVTGERPLGWYTGRGSINTTYSRSRAWPICT